MDVDPSPEGAYREKVRRQIVAYVHAQIKRGSSGGRKMSKAESAAVEVKVAAKVLDAVVGERFGFDPDADRDGTRSAVKKAELWYLKNR